MTSFWRQQQKKNPKLFIALQLSCIKKEEEIEEKMIIMKKKKIEVPFWALSVPHFTNTHTLSAPCTLGSKRTLRLGVP